MLQDWISEVPISQVQRTVKTVEYLYNAAVLQNPNMLPEKQMILEYLRDNRKRKAKSITAIRKEAIERSREEVEAASFKPSELFQLVLDTYNGTVDMVHL